LAVALALGRNLARLYPTNHFQIREWGISHLG
jgi:hypothetical protein